MAKASKRIRVHMVERPNLPLPWRLTPDRWHTGANRYAKLAKKIEVTFGDGSDADTTALATTEILLCVGNDSPALIPKAPNLKWIQATAASVERFVGSVPKTVLLTNSSGADHFKSGEYVMTALLMLNHKVPHFTTIQRHKRWDPLWSTPITGKTAIFIGTGAIGTAAAKRAKPFGLKLIGISRSGKPNKLFHKMAKTKDLARYLPQADFVVVAAPLTPETQGLLDRKALDLLPRHAGVINVARGMIIDHEALVEKLTKGDLGGAILDVFPQEPIPEDSPLWTTPNLMISPHCAVDDRDAHIDHVFDIFYDNFQRYLAGKPMRNRVDLSRGY
jgi:phosphoglycerate dehydrogenase-like enzyme